MVGALREFIISATNHLKMSSALQEPFSSLPHSVFYIELDFYSADRIAFIEGKIKADGKSSWRMDGKWQ